MPPPELNALMAFIYLVAGAYIAFAAVGITTAVFAFVYRGKR